MTNTKFRKRALLSSVAMLLVALVALGSATFAWFAANPDAEADGISMKTTAAAGLVIRTTTDTTWSHNADLNKGGSTVNLQPASQEQSAPDKFWTVIAANSGAYGAKTNEAMTPGAEGSAFYKEDIYCRLSDGSSESDNASKKVYIKGVTITPTAGVNAEESMKNGVRVSIARGNTMLGTWALSTAGANGTLTTAAQSSGDFSPALAATATNLNVDTGLTALKATGTDTSKYITVYVWLDGQDSVVYSDKVGQVNANEIISSVQVDLTLA